MSIKKTGSLDQALNRLVASNAMHVKVGILDNSKYPDGTSVATVAFKNEYGFENIPPRPFMRNTIAEQKGAWSQLVAGTIRGGHSIDYALNLVGLSMANDIQHAIMTFTSPPNSAYTIAKKGFNSPLRDTMLMHDSIKYEVAEGKL